MERKYRPGEIVPINAVYVELTILNRKIREVNCVKGEKFPPTKGLGYHYEIVKEVKLKTGEE